MSGTYSAVMGDRGRLVVPAELRTSAGLEEGTPLVMLETPSGIAVLTRDQALRRVRSELAGTDLVEDLLEERRSASRAEDAAAGAGG